MLQCLCCRPALFALKWEFSNGLHVTDSTSGAHLAAANNDYRLLVASLVIGPNNTQPELDCREVVSISNSIPHRPNVKAQSRHQREHNRVFQPIM